MALSLWSVWSHGLWGSSTLMGLGLKHTESQDVVLMLTENGNVLSSCSQTGWSLLPRGFAIKGAGTRRWKERVKRRVSDSAIALGKGHWNQRKSILKR